MYSDLNHSYQKINDIQSQIVKKEFHFKTGNLLFCIKELNFLRSNRRLLYSEYPTLPKQDWENFNTYVLNFIAK